MSDNKSTPQKTDVCRNSGLETYMCDCSECTGFFLDAAQLIGSQDISEAIERLDWTSRLFEYLFENGFDVQYNHEYNYFRLIPPLVSDGKYWKRCPGCFVPLLMEPDDSPEIVCNSCYEIIQSEEKSVKYYGDLFEYISIMFDMRRELAHDLSYTEEFCEIHNLDFRAVKQRLNDTGGYDEGEVMMNSTGNIPLFEKVPVKKGG